MRSADDLALELGEGQEDVQREPPHGGGGVELWVTETKVTPLRSKTSTSFEKSISERDRRSIL